MTDVRTRSISELMVGAVVLAAGLGFGWLSLAFDLQLRFGRPGPGFLPLWLSGGMAVCGVLLIARSSRAATSGRPDDPSSPRRSKALFVLGSLGLLAVAQLIAGFLIAASLFLTVVLCLIERIPVVRGIPVAVGVTAGMYFVFGVLLRVALPTGLLFR